jgi:hypothetical protein
MAEKKDEKKKAAPKKKAPPRVQPDPKTDPIARDMVSDAQHKP